MVLSLGLFLNVPAVAQEKKEEPGKKMTKKEEHEQALTEAWGFMMSQKMLLERAALKFPDLKEVSILVWAEFKKTDMGIGLAGVEALLKEKKGKEWDEYQLMVLGQMRAKLAKGDMNEDAAKEIVRRVKEMTAAKIPPDVLMVLMSAHPKFVEGPIEEIKQGYQRRISSKGMEKAAGVVMEMQCPASWKAFGGGTPRMVWKLQNRAGYGNVVSNFTALKLSEKLPKEEVAAALKMPTIKKMAPQNATLISAKELTLGGKPAGMLIYDMLNLSNPNERVPFRIVQISCVAKGVLVQLQFAMSQEKDSDLSLNDVTKLNMPLIQFMAESVKFEG